LRIWIKVENQKHPRGHSRYKWNVLKRARRWIDRPALTATTRKDLGASVSRNHLVFKKSKADWGIDLTQNESRGFFFLGQVAFFVQERRVFYVKIISVEC